MCVCTLFPTQAPSGVPLGTCSNPRALTVGSNTVNNPNNDVTMFVNQTGSACAGVFTRTWHTTFYSITPNVTGQYTFSTCNSTTFGISFCIHLSVCIAID